MTIDITDLRLRHANAIRNTATGKALEQALQEIERLRAAMEAVASLAGRDWLIGQLALTESLSGKGGQHLQFALIQYEKARAAGGGDE